MPNNRTFLDTFIDFIFAPRLGPLMLLSITLVGFLLRLIVAVNVPVSADNMVHALHAIGFLQADRLIDYTQSAGLWHLLTSLGYTLFGIGQVSSRLIALVFGTLSIPLFFLFIQEITENKKLAYISAFLLAIAPFHIINTVAEMDVAVLFFVLFSLLFFERGIKQSSALNFIFAGVMMGLALYLKVYVALFLPSFLLYYIYRNLHTLSSQPRNHIRFFALFLGCAFIFTLVTLFHNYLLFQNKGFVDLQFTGALDIGKETSAQYFGWDGHFNATSQWKSLFFGNSPHTAGWSTAPTLLVTLDFIFEKNPIVFIFGLLGFFFSYRSHSLRPLFFLTLFFILFLWPYLATIMLLSKHYLFLELFFIPLASISLVQITNFLVNKYNWKTLRIALYVLLLSTIFSLGFTDQIYGKSAISQMIEYKNENIPDSALIIGDSRIYRPIQYWMFAQKSTLETNEFLELYAQQDKMKGKVLPVTVYYIECVPDDCGWGTIADQPSFNVSMEQFTSEIIKQATLKKEISEPSPNKAYFPFISRSTKRPYYRVYALTLHLQEEFLIYARQTRSWFLYPIGYPIDEPLFDAYVPQTSFQRFLFDSAWTISRLALVFALGTLLLLSYLLFRFYQNE